MRKIISIIFYVISGFFFYSVCAISFVNQPPNYAKFIIIGIFCVPALIALGIGLALSRFQNWKRDTGIVIISAAGVTTGILFTMICMFMSPEFKEYFPENNFESLSDYVSGISCIVILGITGVLLIMKGRKKPPTEVES